MTWIRIVAPHFVAGADIRDNRVVRPIAPIIRYMIGWDLVKVQNYCIRKSWTLELYNGQIAATHDAID